jgi:hypothetical protein
LIFILAHTDDKVKFEEDNRRLEKEIEEIRKTPHRNGEAHEPVQGQSEANEHGEYAAIQGAA